MIKELDEDLEASQDLEVEFAIAGAVRECSGLEILLEIVQVCFHFLILLYVIDAWCYNVFISLFFLLYAIDAWCYNVFISLFCC